MSVSLAGEVGRVTFYKEDTGWAVFTLIPSQTEGAYSPTVKVAGVIHEVYPGQILSLEGKYTEHPKFGKQFQFSHYRISSPTSVDGIRYFLTHSLPYFGSERARAAVELFGTDIFNVLDNEIEKLKQIPGITDSNLPAIRIAWQRAGEDRELGSFLSRFGISKAKVEAIKKEFGKSAINRIKTNPYILTRVAGLGFLTVDRYARDMGISSDSPLRRQAALIYCLEQETVGGGNSYLTFGELLHYVKKLNVEDLDNSTWTEKEALTHLKPAVADGSVVVEQSRIYLRSVYDAEVLVADLCTHLTTLKSAPLLPGDEFDAFVKSYQDFEGIEFSTEQLDALKLVNSSPLVVVTGLPGTGKTTVVRAIARLLETANLNYGLCAPTGKAARRLEEVTGRKASTIHRYYGFCTEFEQWSGGAKDRAVILDEASMVPVTLAKVLLQGLLANPRLVIVGDPAQLPAIGPGNFLQDLKDSSRIPSVHLTQVHRQSLESDIVHNAHRVLHGEPLELRDREDFRAVFSESAADLQDVLDKAVLKLEAAKAEYQILCPMRKKTIGTENLNLRIRELVNPMARAGGFTIGSTTYYPGDRVLVTKNNYDVGVVNGDTGVVTAITNEGTKLVVQVDGYVDPKYFTKSESIGLDLGYAITVHKSQGSEFDVVVLLLHSDHIRMLNRNLLYTAMTRAKKKLILLGSSKAITAAINRHMISARNSYLLERISESDGECPVQWKSGKADPAETDELVTAFQD